MRIHASTPALRYPALLFLAGFLAHNADHLRRGLAVLTPEVLSIGSLSGVITLAAIGLTLLNYRFSQVLALAVGFGMALGVSIVHLLPRWSAFSDSLVQANADAFTWLAVLAEIGGALIFALAGLRLAYPTKATR